MATGNANLTLTITAVDRASPVLRQVAAAVSKAGSTSGASSRTAASVRAGAQATKQATSGLGAFTGQARQFTQMAAQMQGGTASALGGVEALAAGLGGASAVALGAAAAVAAVGYGLYSVGSKAIQGAKEVQGYRGALETLLKSGDKADEMLGKLEKFADVTPFDDTAVNRSAQVLLGMGVSADALIQTMTALGDASMGDTEKFKGLALAFGQMQAKGKVQGEELLQFAERGIPVYDILQKQLGMSRDQLNKLSSSGKLLSKDVLPILVKGLEEEFGGGMERASKRAAGLESNIEALGARMYKSLGATMLPFYEKALGTILTWFERLSAQVKEYAASPEFTAFLESSLELFNSLMLIVEPVVDVLFDMGKTIIAILTPAFKVLSFILQLIAPFVRMIANAFKAFFSVVRAVANVIKDAITWLKPWMVRIQEVATAVETAVGKFIDWIKNNETLKGLLTAVADAAKWLWEKIKELLEWIGSLLLKAVEWIKQFDFVKDAINAVSNAVSSLIDWLKDLGTKEAKPKVDIDDQATQKAKDIKTEIDKIQDKNVTVNVTPNVGAVPDVSLPADKSIKVTIDDQTGTKITQIKSEIDKIQDKNVSVNVTPNVGTIPEITLPADKAIKVTIDDQTGTKIPQIKTSLDTLTEKKIPVSIDDKTDSTVTSIETKLNSSNLTDDRWIPVWLEDKTDSTKSSIETKLNSSNLTKSRWIEVWLDDKTDSTKNSIETKLNTSNLTNSRWIPVWLDDKTDSTKNSIENKLNSSNLTNSRWIPVWLDDKTGGTKDDIETKLNSSNLTKSRWIEAWIDDKTAGQIGWDGLGGTIGTKINNLTSAKYVPVSVTGNALTDLTNIYSKWQAFGFSGTVSTAMVKSMSFSATSGLSLGLNSTSTLTLPPPPPPPPPSNPPPSNPPPSNPPPTTGGGAQGGSGQCFEAGTPVWLWRGDAVAIEDVRVGMLVLSWDEADACFVPAQVSALIRHDEPSWRRWTLGVQDESETDPWKDRAVDTTREHSFLTVAGDGTHVWRQAETLWIGDRIRGITEEGESSILRVTRSVPRDHKAKMYNFEVDRTHTYVVGWDRCVVHNAQKDPGGAGGTPTPPPSTTPPPDTGGCFIAGTPVWLADGTSIPVQDVRPDMAVMSWDEDAAAFVPSVVTSLHPSWGMVQAVWSITVDGHETISTYGHPYLIDDDGALKWMPAHWLRAGDVLVGYGTDGTSVRHVVTSSLAVYEPAAIYNFEVAGTHTYVVGDRAAARVVHNGGGKIGGRGFADPGGKALGGIIMSRTRAVLGEHQPEVVIPLSRLPDLLPSIMSGGGSGMAGIGTVVINVSGYDNPAQAGQSAAEAFRRQLGLQRRLPFALT